jgi:hypothetical protein
VANGATRIVLGSSTADDTQAFCHDDPEPAEMEIAQTLPVELLRLMGYDRGAYSLGYIDDRRDPIAAVLPDVGDIGYAATGTNGCVA